MAARPARAATPTWPALLLLCLLVASASPARPEPRGWKLWPSPFDGTETPDQAQTSAIRGSHVGARAGEPVGQVFVPQRSPLLRLDLAMDAGKDTRPGLLRLWRWRGSYPATVSRPPLFESDVAMGGDVGFEVHSYFPRIPVEVGQPYLAELSVEGRGPVRLRHWAGPDTYPEGWLLRGGKRAQGRFAGWDLWFRTFSDPAPGATAPAQAESRPSLDEPRWSPPPEPRGGARQPSADAYLERVRAFADVTRKARVEACRQKLGGRALLEAVLYRASCQNGRCDESHAEAVRRMLLGAHAWLLCGRLEGRRCQPACDPTELEHIGYEWLERPSLAYLWTRDSKRFSPQDHARVRELLTAAGRSYWEHREVGFHNRAMQAAVGYLLLAQLFPDAPQAKAWRGYADAVWQEFWAARDSPEDSAQYQAYGWWPSLLLYTELAGLEDEVWSDAGFRALVERFYQQTAPLGVLPNYGDDSGWSRDGGGLVFLFEKAGAWLREPRYRWLARRLFDYHSSHARDDPPRDDSLYRSLPVLGLAYLAADESLEAVPPAQRHEEAFAEQRATPDTWWRVEPGEALGQTFLAGEGPLVRLELLVDGLGSAAPFELSIWRWLGDRKSSAARAPLFRSTAPAAPSAGRVVMRPFLELERGAPYYVEVERREAPLALGGAGGTGDPYPAGRRVASGEPRAGDLWFGAWTLSGDGSAVTWRRRFENLPRETWGQKHWRRYRARDERVPDKLVLRSGSRPEDLFVLVNLLGLYLHGHPEVGAVTSVIDGGSVLILDAAYPYGPYRAVRENESAPLLRRYWGGSAGAPGRHARVLRFDDARDVTVAAVGFRESAGWNVEHERHFLFAKNRFLLVRDRFSFPEAMEVAAGPVWHAGHVGRSHGAHWFDVSTPEPLSDVWKLHNPERYALLWFVPREGWVASAVDEPVFHPPGCAPRPGASRVSAKCRFGPSWVISQRRTGEVPAGGSLWFDTLVLPHGPDAAPRELAKGVRVLHAAGGNLALEVALGEERWTVVDRPGGGAIEVPGLATDARTALVRTRPGAPPYVFAQEATRLELDGVSLHWPVASSVELGGSLPPTR
jgi:hypothetical protein